MHSFFTVPWLLCSATLSTSDIHKIAKIVNLKNFKTISKSVNRPNIFLSIKSKLPNQNLFACMSCIIEPLLHELSFKQNSFPVTLMFMPLQWISYASSEAEMIFGYKKVPDCIWSIYTSNIDDSIKHFVERQLMKSDPTLRLVFSTSALSMGIDCKCISRVIHCTPPRNMSDLVQEIGRCGRDNQAAESIVYFNNSDLARPNMDQEIISYCRTKDCLRKKILSVFGFDDQDPSFVERCCSNCDN